MASQLPPLRDTRRLPRARALGALLLVFALCVRLAWPGPPGPLPAGDFGLAAAFGEHALCLAAAAADGKAPLPGDGGPQQPGDHADHDGLGCCLWHAASGVTLPRIAGVSAVLFFAASVLLPAAEVPPPISRSVGPLQARAPPTAA